MTGSNRRQSPCKGGALPAELITQRSRAFYKTFLQFASICLFQYEMSLGTSKGSAYFQQSMSLNLRTPLKIQSSPKCKARKTKKQCRVTLRLAGTKKFAIIRFADCLLTPLRNAAAGMKSGFLEVPLSGKKHRSSVLQVF